MEGGHTCVVVVGCWTGGCPVSNTYVALVFLFFVADGGRSGADEPLGRVAPNTKVSLCVWIGFGGCAPVCRLGGAGEG